MSTSTATTGVASGEVLAVTSDGLARLLGQQGDLTITVELDPKHKGGTMKQILQLLGDLGYHLDDEQDGDEQEDGTIWLDAYLADSTKIRTLNSQKPLRVVRGNE